MTNPTALPEQMTAISIAEPGGPEALQPQRMAVPQPGAGEVLIKVAAAGVNRPDIMQRQGLYPPPKGASPIPGLEIAGEVVAAGQGVTRYKPDDQVCALVTGGGYAEYCVADEGATLPVPSGMEVVAAAALPETFFTVWINVFERGGLQPGEVFLIHGGTSGIGTTAIQLASAFGARVFTTARGSGEMRDLQDAGAERAIDYEARTSSRSSSPQTDGHGADVILDMVGGDYVSAISPCAAEDGRIGQIAFLRGAKVEVDFTRC